MNKQEQLKKIDNEDIIWIINFIIVFFALLSNNYEKSYIINNDYNSQKKYKTINIAIFIVLFFIYSYITYNRIVSVCNIKSTTPHKEILIDDANLIASILILIGALIYLVDEILDDNISSEDIGLF